VPSLIWLVYRRSGALISVAIVEASSPIAARLRAAIDGLDTGVTFQRTYRSGAGVQF